MSEKFLKKTKPGMIIVLIILSVVTGMGVSGILSTQRTVNSSGSIKAINVGVYTNLACTQNVSSVDWGTPEPGQVITRTVYVKNTGNANMTLYLSVNNWTPANASDYLSVTWDEEATGLAPDEVVEAILSLTVDNAITGIDNFSVQIVVGGTG